MSLTFGFPTTSDPGAWYTLNAFRVMHYYLKPEIVIVDNSPPNCPISNEFSRHVAANHREVNYIRDAGPPSSCLYKDKVFQAAHGDIVISVDSHVLLPPGTVDAVIEYFEANPDSGDLLTGPCMNSAGNLSATNQFLFESEGYVLPRDAVIRHGYVCRGGQLGTWVIDQRGADPGGEPFQIRMNGTGFLAMRKEAYPGFPANLWGFGGCEPALYRRVENAGGRVLCHPGCRWIHNFSHAHGRGYQPMAEDKIRNYLVIARELEDQDLYSAALEHFATIHPSAIGPAITQAGQVALGTFKPRSHTGAAPQKETSCSRKQPPALPAEQFVETIEPPMPKNNPPAPKKQKPVKQSAVYLKYMEKWKAAGGDVGGSCPAPLFVQIAHLHAMIPTSEGGESRPVRTLEFGCGLSTLGFDRQGTDHTAIEHDEKWIERVKAQLKPDTKVKIIHAPIKDGWYDWEPAYGDLYDVILIDGPPGNIGREGCLEVVPKIMGPHALLLIDDTHREVEQKISTELAAALGLQVIHRLHGERAFDMLVPPPEPLGEGPGTVLVERFKAMKMPSCQRCMNLARKMNKWGPEGCRQNMDYIVNDILPRARAWWQASNHWMKAEAWFKDQQPIWSRMKLARGLLTKDVTALLRDSVTEHVHTAIEEYEQQKQASS
jgi:hypothetical protein